jgi:hypothetical protein
MHRARLREAALIFWLHSMRIATLRRLGAV